ncbi:MAG: peptidoglycan DD-metalloendopeptidase family protein [Symbiobacteriaceae bacterium]
MTAVRPFAESLGYKASYDSTSKMITVYKPGYWLTMWIGTHVAFQNDRPVWPPVKPYLKNGQAMVPAWWLAVRLGADVAYSNATLTVSNGYRPAQPAPGVNPNPRPDSPFADPSYVFPFPKGATYSPYTDTMGAARQWNGESWGHEGTDIPAPKGTPIVAVASGTIIRYGWNTLGGYRLTIELDDHPGYRFYYAHLSGYAPGLKLGSHVEKGQLLGYVGSTGEGPEGTSGRFIDHLHFGIYDPNWNAINPYPLLKYWEGNKAEL